MIYESIFCVMFSPYHMRAPNNRNIAIFGDHGMMPIKHFEHDL